MFTKNLALLQIMIEQREQTQRGRNGFIGAQGSKEGMYQSQSSKNDNQAYTSTNYQSSSSNASSICQEHQKVIEAFCWTDKHPLCIDCLLSQAQHKQHDVLNIEKSLEREEQNLKAFTGKLATSKTKIQKNQDLLLKLRSELDFQEQDQTTALNKFFTELREAIDLRQRKSFFALTKAFETRRKFFLSSEVQLKDLSLELNSTDFQLLSTQFSNGSQIDQLMSQVAKESQAQEILEKVDGFQIKMPDSEEEETKVDFKKEIQQIVKIISSISESLGISAVGFNPSGAMMRKNSVVNQNHLGSLQLSTPSAVQLNRQSHRDLSQVHKLKIQTKEPSQLRKSTHNFFTEQQNKQVTPVPARGTQIPTKNIKTQAKHKQSTARAQNTPGKQAPNSQELKTKDKRITNQRASSRLQYSDVGQQQISSIKFARVEQNTPSQIKETSFEQSLRQRPSMTKSSSKARNIVNKSLPNAQEEILHAIQQNRGSVFQVPQSTNISMLIRETLNKSVSESENEDCSSYNSLSKQLSSEKYAFQSTALPSMRRADNKNFASTINSSVLIQNQEQDQKQPFLNTTNLEKLSQSNNSVQTHQLNTIQVNQMHRPSLRDMRNNFKKEKNMSLKHQIQNEQWKTKQVQNIESVAIARQISSRREGSKQSRILEMTSGKDSYRQMRSSISAIRISNQQEEHNQEIFIQSSRDKALETTINNDMSKNDFDVNIDDSNLYSFVNTTTPKHLIQELNGVELLQAIKDDSIQQMSELKQKVGIIGGVSDSDNPSGIILEIFDPSKEKKQVKKTLINHNNNLKIGDGYKVINDPRDEFSLLIIGGKVNGKFNNKISQINPFTQNIQESEIPDLPCDFEDFQYFTCCSGLNESDQNLKIPMMFVAIAYKHQQDDQNLSIFSYNFKSQQWSQLPPISHNPNSQDEPQTKPLLSEFQLIQNNNYLYLIGGHFDGVVSKKVYRYDLLKHQDPQMMGQDQEQQGWETLPEMKEGRVYFTTTKLHDSNNEGIVIIGGYDGEKVLNTCEFFDVHTCQWTSLSPLNEARMYSSSIFLENDSKLLVIGGVSDNEELLNTVESFDINNKIWQKIMIDNQESTSLSKRFSHSLVKILM